ncbi:zinc finger MYM-type protein 1 [Trichonephila clavipes]|nr:zinc finger MYM-type protein 1 [Trichonephila clavipes]
MSVWLTRNENKSVLDKQLQEQLRKDTKYYHNVLKRVIAAVKYLAIIGLSLRGTEEVFGSPHNDKSTEKAAYGTENFKRDKLIVALDKLILDLNRCQVYADYSKKFKFLDLQDQSKENIDLESVRAIIDYYSDDVDQHLVKEGT